MYSFAFITGIMQTGESMSALSDKSQEINVVGGTLLPEGQVAVEKGTDQLFTAAAKAGYMVDYYVIDGVTVSVTDTEFLFEAVDGAHDIKVHFKKQ